MDASFLELPLEQDRPLGRSVHVCWQETDRRLASSSIGIWEAQRHAAATAAAGVKTRILNPTLYILNPRWIQLDCPRENDANDGPTQADREWGSGYPW